MSVAMKKRQTQVALCAPRSDDTIWYPPAPVEGWTTFWDPLADADEIADGLKEADWNLFGFLVTLLRHWQHAWWCEVDDRGKVVDHYAGRHFYYTAWPFADVLDAFEEEGISRRTGLAKLAQLEELKIVRIVRQGTRIKWIEPVV